MSQTVLIGITSGIAAFKSLELIKSLKEENITVKVILTSNAHHMLPMEELEEITDGSIFTELFGAEFNYEKTLKERRVEHIDLADEADLLVIVPATANVLGKLAHGIADDLLCTVALAMTAPIIVCPSMNVNMWNNPLVQNNLNILRKSGYEVVEPSTGMLACGYEGKGRLEEISVIKKHILKQLQRTSSLKGKKIIITSGGTSEKIDDVRSITNKSSGKMGSALAEECYLRGADVVLLRAKDSVKPRYLMKEFLFTSADDLYKLTQKHVLDADALIHTAAVSDFKIIKSLKGKISSKENFKIELVPLIKIVNEVKKINPLIKLIAFKAEYGLKEKDLLEISFNKLREAKADAIIANDISKGDRGFGSDMNEVYIVSGKDQVKKIPLNFKNIIAKEILDYLQKIFVI